MESINIHKNNNYAKSGLFQEWKKEGLIIRK